MFKGIAFIEESKSEPKRDGFRHRKRTFRTIDFDFSVFLNEMTCIIRISALTVMSSTGTFELNFFFLQLYVISWNFELLRNVAGILY